LEEKEVHLVKKVSKELGLTYKQLGEKTKWDLETEILVQGKCTKLPAQIAVMKLKCLLSQKKADLFIAGIVIKNIENFRFYTSRFSDLFFFFFLIFMTFFYAKKSSIFSALLVPFL